MDVRRLFALGLMLAVLAMPASAAPIRWVDLQVSTEALSYAISRDVATFEQEKHIPFVEILALAACRTGGKCPVNAVKKSGEGSGRGPAAQGAAGGAGEIL